MAQVVTFGIFRFKTKAQLDAIREEFAGATGSEIMNPLSSASVNGQQFSFAGVAYERSEFGDMLAAAYNNLGEYRYGTPASNRCVADFRAGGDCGALYRNC